MRCSIVCLKISISNIHILYISVKISAHRISHMKQWDWEICLVEFSPESPYSWISDSIHRTQPRVLMITDRKHVSQHELGLYAELLDPFRNIKLSAMTGHQEVSECSTLLQPAYGCGTSVLLSLNKIDEPWCITFTYLWKVLRYSLINPTTCLFQN